MNKLSHTCDSIPYPDDPKYMYCDRQVGAIAIDRSGLIVQTQEQSDQGLHCLPLYYNSVCIFWTHNCLVKPLCSNFRIITTIFFLMSNFFHFFRF